jgi:SAM-dependent methyltransferase
MSGALIRRSAAVGRKVRQRVLGPNRVADGQTPSPDTPPNPSRVDVRRNIARHYLRGSGIEIGALNLPLATPSWVNVRYVDYLPIETLREHHVHLLQAGETLVAPDVVDDGEKLETFPDESLDFVIANHFIEHSEDPIRTLASHLRVIRPGGILFLGVPDKRHTFDHLRPVTPLEHLIRDHEQGPQVSRRAHYLEWSRLVDKIPADQVEAHASEQEARRFSIHFHVFTPDAFLQLLLHCRATGLPIEVELFRQNEVEFIVVLRKSAGAPATA